MEQNLTKMGNSSGFLTILKKWMLQAQNYKDIVLYVNKGVMNLVRIVTIVLTI